jgi:hypothetical protein
MLEYICSRVIFKVKQNFLVANFLGGTKRKLNTLAKSPKEFKSL